MKRWIIFAIALAFVVCAGVPTALLLRDRGKPGKTGEETGLPGNEFAGKENVGKESGETEEAEDSERWVVVESSYYYRGELTDHSEYQYDKNGLCEIRSVSYNRYENTETRERTVIEYDSRGLRVKEMTYDQQSGELRSYRVYIRDEDGALLQTETYRGDGSLSTREKHYPEEELRDRIVETYYYENGVEYVGCTEEYDSRGNRIRFCLYDQDGALFYSSESTFDDRDREIQSQVKTYFMNQLQDVTDYTYEYDENDLLIRTTYTSRGTGETTVGEYVYDENNNQIRYVFTCNGEELGRQERVFRLYKNGALVGEAPAVGGEEAPPAPAETGKVMEGQRIVIHRGWVLGLKNDGSVLAAGGDNAFGSNMAVLWEDIVAIDGAVNGNMKTVLGLKKDGTVVAAGWNLVGECDVSDWTDIVQIGSVIDNSYGLKADGTIVAVGNDSYGACDVGNITNGARMYMQEHSNPWVLVLNKDGSVSPTANQWQSITADFSDFTDIRNLTLSRDTVFGVTNDGRVVSSQKLPDEVRGWTNISRVFVNSILDDLVIGLREDGTVAACAASNYNGEEAAANAVRSWTDIKDIFVFAGYSNYDEITVVGVKKDGSVISTGGDIDLTGFYDIEELYAYDDSYTKRVYLAGVRKDGTVVSNDPDVADAVAAWKLF